MLGIIPSGSKTFEVEGYFNAPGGDLVEGKLYCDPKDGRIYYYSKTNTRPNPDTGYFPIWDGKNKYITKFSKKKYIGADVTTTDLSKMASGLNREIANQVILERRRNESGEPLQPAITDEDNMFTQCVKGIITNKKMTMFDLYSNACPPLTKRTIDNYYSSLIKIAFMRLDKWHIWINTILKVRYVITVKKGRKQLLTYTYPDDVFDTGVVKYDAIAKSSNDPLKKIIQILMVMENITKQSLKSDEVDDYTINNMFTTLTSDKAMSAQLFGRFIRMAGLSYKVNIFDREQMIFEYKE